MCQSSSTIPLAILSLDREALRQAIVEALKDPSVLEGLRAALVPAGIGGALPKFMGAQEYAKHARMSPRSLSYARSGMTEGVHYSRTGRRVRFHVAEADEFLASVKSDKTGAEVGPDSIEALARSEAARRRAKTSGGR
jgi:hypothetical protein